MATSASSSGMSSRWRPSARSASIRSSTADSRSSSSLAISTWANESYANSASGGPRQSASPSRSLAAASSACPAVSALLSLLDQRLEAMEVELAGRDRQHVAVRTREEDAVLTRLSVLGSAGSSLEPPAQLRDERVNALRRARRRLGTPEVVDDLVDRHDLVRAQQEQGEQSALLMPAEREALSLGPRPRADRECGNACGSPPFASNLAPLQPAA